MLRSVVLWRAVLGIILGFGIPIIAVGQPSSPDIIQDTVRLAQEGTVEISDTHTGTIRVTTWDRAQVAYEITPASGEDSGMVSNVSVSHTDQEFSIDQDGASWTLHIPGLLRISPGGGEDLAVRYRVTMPRTATLEIDDFASTIEVSDVEANVELDTHQGEVIIDSVDGMLDLDTHAGSITATGIRGGVSLDTHAGKASVSFEDFSAPSTAETHSGTLHFFLPAEAGFTLQTDLVSADLTIDEAFGTPSTDDEHRAFNDGGPTLTLDAFSGTVTVRPVGARETTVQR